MNMPLRSIFINVPAVFFLGGYGKTCGISCGDMDLVLRLEDAILTYTDHRRGTV
jgi:hypothetical protein